MKTTLQMMIAAAVIALLTPALEAQNTANKQQAKRSFRLQIGRPGKGLSLEIGRANELSKAFQQAAERIRPSVVGIHAKRRIAARQEARPEQIPDLPDEFKRFFGEDSFERYFRQRVPQRDFVQRGFGTGVIVSEDGHIVTNSHVIRGAQEIKVRLEDGRDFVAKVIGSDDQSEIAVIRIDATGLSAATLGDSEALKVGQWVLAVGNPFHLAQTVTAGIVSARGRSNVGIADYENFIQTDAAVNPGNSGGPLINLAGEVVGINTAIASRTGGYMGIAFAIPSNMVRSVTNQLVEHGRVDRGLMGIMVQDLTPSLATSFGYEGKDGALVADVSADGPAARAGIKSGDILTRLNGESVTSTSELRNTIAGLRPGTVVHLDYFREGHTRSIEVKLAAVGGGRTETTGHSPDRPSQLGLEVQDATPELMDQLGNDRNQSGIVVKDFTPGGSADDAGIKMADVIIAVNGKRVTDTESYRREIARSRSQGGIRLQILRKGMRTYVFLRFPTSVKSESDTTNSHDVGAH